MSWSDVQSKPLSTKTRHKGRNEAVSALKGRNPVFTWVTLSYENEAMNEADDAFLLFNLILLRDKIVKSLKTDD